MLEAILKRFSYVESLEDRIDTLNKGLELGLKKEFKLRKRLKNAEVALADHKEMLGILQETNCTIKRQAHESEERLQVKLEELERKLEEREMIVAYLMSKGVPSFQEGSWKRIYMPYKEQERFRDRKIVINCTGPDLGLTVKTEVKS